MAIRLYNTSRIDQWQGLPDEIDMIYFGIDTPEPDEGVVVDAQLRQILNDGYGNVESFYSIERFFGSRYDDELLGRQGNEMPSQLSWMRWADSGRGGFQEHFMGGDGIDLIDGRGGVDTLNLGVAAFDELLTNPVEARVDLKLGYVDDQYGTRDIVRNIENVWGSRWDEVIRGDGNTNILAGRGGSDTIDGDSGFDFFLAIDYAADVDLIEGTNTVEANDSVDTLISIEGVIGSAEDDTIRGDSGNNILIGRDGVDSMYGRDGDDTFFGGRGNDVLDGGLGSDTAQYFEEVADFQFEQEGGSWVLDTTVGSSSQGRDSLVNIEKVLGTDGAWTYSESSNSWIFNSTADNRIEGGAGADQLFGSTSKDIIDAGDGDDFVTSSFGDDQIDGGPGLDTFRFNGVFHEEVSFSKSALGTISLNNITNRYSLENIERIAFEDKWVALDLEGNAGNAAKIIACAFGIENLGTYVGTGIALLDAGETTQSVADLIIKLDLIPHTTNTEFVNTIYENTIGRAPNILESAIYVDMLETNVYSKSELLKLAASTPFAENQIIEVALNGIGLPYDSTFV